MEPAYLSNLLSGYAPLRALDETGLVIHQANDFFILWDAMEQLTATVCPAPFWAIVWPANRLLSRYILANRTIVSDKTVLDIGCGCGAASIAAACAGAREVVADDIDPIALSVSHENAHANNVDIITSNINLLENPPDHFFDVILLADMFYEASATSPLFTFLHEQVRRGSGVYIADAGRPFTPRERLEPLMKATFDVDPDVEGVGTRTSTLYQLTDI